jgi:hypothetical protein
MRQERQQFVAGAVVGTAAEQLQVVERILAWPENGQRRRSMGRWTLVEK